MDDFCKLCVGMWLYVLVCGGMWWYVLVCGGMWWYVVKSVTRLVCKKRNVLERILYVKNKIR